MADRETSLAGIMDIIRTAEDATSMSLTQYARRSIISSRVFIDDTIADEPALGNFLSSVMDLYVGLIFTALDMNNMVTDCMRVRDMMSVVATEDFGLPINKVKKLKRFDEVLTSSLGNHLSPHLRSAYHLEDQTIVQPADPILTDEAYLNELTDSNETTAEGNIPDDVNLNNVEPATEDSKLQRLDYTPTKAKLPSGRTLEVKFKTDCGNELTVNLFLELNPTFIPPDVAEQFININFTPSIRQRWLQASAGEISFFKDFLFAQDMRKKRLKARKEDKTGLLKEMEERRENALANSWSKLLQITPDRQNIANTILVYNESNLQQFCSNAGLKIQDYNSRQKFFNRTFSMMLCSLDPMYNKCRIYYHGLPNFSEFTFDQLRISEKQDGLDLISIMNAYQKNQAPKF